VKTAISLPDALFERVDALAAKMHMSRSQLYVQALELFLREHQDDRITESPNAYIDERGQPVDRTFLDSALRDMRKVEW
jgi:predicted transcriptional regulator